LAPPNIYETGPSICEKWQKWQLVIVTHIWQKLSNVERKVSLIVIHFWQLFSRIFGQTLRIVTNIWPNPALFSEYGSFRQPNTVDLWPQNQT
jgi:hypothetical protein